MRNIILSVFFVRPMGCNNWLDVNPARKRKEDELLSSEDGYKSALTGVYIQLSLASVVWMYHVSIFRRCWLVRGRFLLVAGSLVDHYLGRWDYNKRMWKPLIRAKSGSGIILVLLRI